METENDNSFLLKSLEQSVQIWHDNARSLSSSAQWKSRVVPGAAIKYKWSSFDMELLSMSKMIFVIIG